VHPPSATVFWAEPDAVALARAQPQAVTGEALAPRGSVQPSELDQAAP